MRRKVITGAGRRLRRSARRLRRRVTPTRVRLPRGELPAGPLNRPQVRAAVILDEFSEMALRYEWQQVRVMPGTWRSELAERRPDLLFVESAWRGNAGAWQHTMSGEGAPAPELVDLVSWCRSQHIPTVFWNKEDPPNYQRFLPTARLFDHVFTVDAERIPDYQHDLGHDRVHLLPFAAQPRIHNPVRHDDSGATRPHDVAFAGTYFTEKHPERRAQVDMLLRPALDHGLHIFSRMQFEDPRYRFPPDLAAHVVGSLPYDRMLAAYSAYKVFLNVNSVTRSPSMCSRRLFELSAAQTAVVSAPAASIEPFFGDTIPIVSTPEAADEVLHNLLAHAELRDRQALRAHRRVHDQHLYEHRAATVLRTIGVDAPEQDRSVSAVVPTMRPDQLDNVWRFMHRQSHPDVQLVLVTHGFDIGSTRVAELQARWPLTAVEVVAADARLPLGTLMNRGVDAASGRYVAKMDDDNYYAEHYLRDLVRAFSWTDALVVGKWAHYVHIGDDSGPTLLRFADSEHRYTRLVQGGTIITPREVATGLRFEPLPRRVDTTFLEKVHREDGRVYSSDRFNFVSRRSTNSAEHTWTVSADHILARSSELRFYGPAEQHVTC